MDSHYSARLLKPEHAGFRCLFDAEQSHGNRAEIDTSVIARLHLSDPTTLLAAYRRIHAWQADRDEKRACVDESRSALTNRNPGQPRRAQVTSSEDRNALLHNLLIADGSMAAFGQFAPFAALNSMP